MRLPRVCLALSGDTIEDMKYDIEQLAQEDLFACQLTLLTPYHKTKLWKEMEHLVNEPDLSKFDLYNLVWDHPHMNPSEARDVLAWAQRQVNSPDRIAASIKRELKQKMRTRMDQRAPAQAAGT